MGERNPSEEKGMGEKTNIEQAWLVKKKVATDLWLYYFVEIHSAPHRSV